ncbi:MAG TPA: cyclic nucleotide-binding domain-containing protein, partial [Planctomycetota bacterium]|nr:cyclic nucleotide-binding domain-containing protein [Planctomycetota bacterium]
MKVPAPAPAPAPASPASAAAKPAPEAEPRTMKVPPPAAAAAVDAGGGEQGSDALKAMAGGLAASLADGSTRRVAPEEIAAALAAARAGAKAPAAAEDLSKTSVVAGPSAAVPAKPAPAAPAALAKPAAPAAPAPAAAAKPAAPAPAAAAKPAAPAAPAAKGPAKSPEEQMLRSIAIFAEASSKPMGDLLKSLADEGKDERAEFRVFAPGAMVCREGEYTADFFVVLSGLAGVFMSDRLEKGKRKYLASLSAGRWFGEMSCMSNAPRSATVVAESDLVVLSVPRHIFMLFYEDRTNKKFRTIVDEEYRKRALANHLGSVALFRGVEDAVLRALSSVAELVVVEKGATVVAEGTPGDAMYLVRTGHAKVVRKAGGQDEILAWLRENSFFGEASLLRHAPRNSSVIAVDRMDLVKLPAKGFLDLLASFPAVKDRILEQARRITEQETLTPEEEGARRRAREIGTEHEVIKAGAALVIDLSKCTRCNMCVEGCVEAHDDHVPRIGKRGLLYGDLLLTSSCYNCKVPDCMLACGFGALRRDRNGQVRVDTDACVGCGMCEPACPYGTIHMQSRVGDEGVTTKASAGPVTGILRSLPLVGKLFAPKPAAAAAPDEAAAPAAGGAAPAAAAKPAGGNVGKAMAVKCDLCAGRSDMACI